MGTAYEILIIFSLILLNGLFAMAEIATLSVRRSRLEKKAAEGQYGAQAALDLCNNPSRFLSTVQIGITLVGILAGTYGGATLAEKLKVFFESISFLKFHAEGLAIGIVVIVITFFSLIIGELVPKQLALRYAETIAIRTSRPMTLLAKIMAPPVSFLSTSTNLVLKLLQLQPTNEPEITEEELRQTIRQARGAGLIEQNEQDLVERTMVIADLKVTSIMTPRTNLVYLDLSHPPKTNWTTIHESGHSYYPVCQDDLDNLVGIVSVKSLWAQIVETGSVNLQGVLEKPLYIPETMSILRALDLLKTTHQSIAIILDEYGGVTGMVTLSDFTKAILLGVHPQLEDEHPWMIQREDGSWLLGGNMPIEELRKVLSLPEIPEMKEAGYQTVGGFVMLNLDKVPSESDFFFWQGYRFEVLDIDGHRVDKVLVSRCVETETNRDVC